MTDSSNSNNATGPIDFEVQARERLAHLDALLSEASNKLQAIRETAGEAEMAATLLSQNQQASNTALSDAQAKVSEITSVATQALAVKTQIADEQAIIATKSDHIQKAQEHADKVRAELDRTLTTATQQATEAEGYKSRSQSSADSAATLLADIRAAKAAVDADHVAIVSLHTEAQEATKTTATLASTSASIETRVADYEKRLGELMTESDTQLKTILGLLPGATSAGLANAFDQRRQTFLKPSVRWQWLFVGSVAALVVLALTGLWNAFHATGTVTYDELFRLWLARLPIAGALIWLAIYASRESALAKRLEEDYGYKSAVAASFLGFHRQMSEIGTVAGTNTPLAKLCEDTLATIASPPGRIYEKQKLTVSPGTELTELVKSVLKAGGIGKASSSSTPQ